MSGFQCLSWYICVWGVVLSFTKATDPWAELVVLLKAHLQRNFWCRGPGTAFFSDEFRFLQNSRFCQVMEVGCCSRVPLLWLPALAGTLLTSRHAVTNCQEEAPLDTVPLSAERLKSNSGLVLTSAARADLSTFAIPQPHHRASHSSSAHWCFGSVLV